MENGIIYSFCFSYTAPFVEQSKKLLFQLSIKVTYSKEFHHSVQCKECNQMALPF